MIVVGVMWGLHGPLLKFCFGAGLTFPQVAAGEYLIGAVVFGVVALATRAPWPQGDRRFWLLMTSCGVIGSGVALFLFWSYQLGPVPVGATLLFLYVPFTQLINFLISRQIPPRLEIISVFLVIAGAVLATDFVSSASATNLRGAPQAILAALFFAGFFVISSRLGAQSTPAMRSFYFSSVSFVVILAVAFLFNWNLLASPMISWKGLGWLAVVGVVGQVVPVFLLVKAAPKTGSGLGSILTSVELPVAVGLSAWLLGDRPRVFQLIGVASVLAGIGLPYFFKSRTAL